MFVKLRFNYPSFLSPMHSHSLTPTHPHTPSHPLTPTHPHTITASVSLTATQGSQSLSIDFTDLIVVSEGMLLTLECLGSGKLIWTSSNGLEISTNPSDGFYQQPDMLNGVQRLVFSNFSRELTAVYSCQTDITTPPVTTAVFITTCELLGNTGFNGLCLCSVHI